jgi:hypothetical protein
MTMIDDEFRLIWNMASDTMSGCLGKDHAGCRDESSQMINARALKGHELEYLVNYPGLLLQAVASGRTVIVQANAGARIWLFERALIHQAMVNVR